MPSRITPHAMRRWAAALVLVGLVCLHAWLGAQVPSRRHHLLNPANGLALLFLVALVARRSAFAIGVAAGTLVLQALLTWFVFGRGVWYPLCAGIACGAVLLSLRGEQLGLADTALARVAATL